MADFDTHVVDYKNSLIGEILRILPPPKSERPQAEKNLSSCSIDSLQKLAAELTFAAYHYHKNYAGRSSIGIKARMVGIAEAGEKILSAMDKLMDPVGALRRLRSSADRKLTP